MVSPEERIKILQMLQEGKITPDAAAQLLQAIDSGSEPAVATPQAPYSSNQPAVLDHLSAAKPRWLRVRVTDTDTGRPRVNVRLPLSLVNMGLKLGSRYSPEIEGLDIQALIEAAQSAEAGPFVDVYDEEDGEHVEVFLE